MKSGLGDIKKRVDERSLSGVPVAENKDRSIMEFALSLRFVEELVPHQYLC